MPALLEGHMQTKCCLDAKMYLRVGLRAVHCWHFFCSLDLKFKT